MTKTSRFVALLGALSLILSIFFLVVRPWYLRWGTVGDETTRPLPGDALVPDAARPGQTRAVTINAPVEQVWPWVAQTGQDRGGFYSYDLLENMVGCEMPTDDYLRPDKQLWKVGDKLWMYPEHKAGGTGFATLRVLEPGRALGFGTRMSGTGLDEPENGSWSFILEPLGDSATRLIVRGMGTGGRSLLGLAFDRGIFEPAHFTMERRMLIGLKEVAETGKRSRTENHIHVVLWIVTFALWIAAVVLVFTRRRWKRPLVGFVAASAIFQILTFLQPSAFPAILLVLALGVFLLWPERRGGIAVK